MAEVGRKVFGMKWELKSVRSVVLLDDGVCGWLAWVGGRWWVWLAGPAEVASLVARRGERGGGCWFAVVGSLVIGRSQTNSDEFF